MEAEELARERLRIICAKAGPDTAIEALTLWDEQLREAEQQAAYNMLVACANFTLQFGEQLGPMIHDRMLEELGAGLKGDGE